jgi:hypothetical protein
MPDIPAPTPEDLARDAPADLEVCDAATPGPWSFDPRGYDVLSPLGTLIACDGRDADLTLIALARTALPAWIRRAVAAEAELRAIVDRSRSWAGNVHISLEWLPESSLYLFELVVSEPLDSAR